MDQPEQVLNEAGNLEDVIELCLCEVPHLCLRPDRLYRFVKAPGCAKCEEADLYKDEE